MFFDNSFDIYLFEQFLRDKRKLSDSSLYNYIRAVEKYLIETKDATSIEELNKFIIKYAIKKRSIYYYSALKAFIEYKIDEPGQRASMISDLIKPETPSTIKRERRYLSEKQIIDMINFLSSTKHKIIALIQDLTGVRAGDVINIVRGNIIPEIYDGKAVLKIIIEGKGQKRNVVFIHDEIAQLLISDYIVNHYIPTGYYFLEDISYTKNSVFKKLRTYKANYKRYYRDLKDAMKSVGIDYSDFATHDYRRCYARRVWTKYKDFHVLQELLNHANPATTMGYLKQSGMQNVEYHKEMQS